jgi:hypothetical protein
MLKFLAIVLYFLRIGYSQVTTTRISGTVTQRTIAAPALTATTTTTTARAVINDEYEGTVDIDRYTSILAKSTGAAELPQSTNSSQFDGGLLFLIASVLVSLAIFFVLAVMIYRVRKQRKTDKVLKRKSFSIKQNTSLARSVKGFGKSSSATSLL